MVCPLKLLQQSQSLGIEIDKKGLKYPVDLLKIIEAVAEKFTLTVKGIRVAKRGNKKKNIPRWMAMKLCQEAGGAKLTEIAAMFNVEHYSTVSQTIRRLNILMYDVVSVANVFNILSQDLTR